MLNEKTIGSYAEGQSRHRVRRGTLRGGYAAGQEEKPRLGTIQPVGDFAAGMEKHPTDPTALRGDFARGQREKPLD
ncbi:MAG: hypothetical protein ACHQ01_10415 [Candidatus Limnocylindrales bacterium]